MRHFVSILFATVGVLSAACADTHAGLPGANTNNYSQIPCAENCGGDATCMANCTPTGPGANSPAQPMEFTHGGK